jgi:hypothetical protein
MRRSVVLPGLIVGIVVGSLAAAPTGAASRVTVKKSMWGPARRDGVSQFPIYRDLGVGIWQTTISWAATAPRRPRHPRDPRDPAYRWPDELDFAVGEARRSGIRVLVQLTAAPRWANGGRPRNWAPKRPADFADFAEATARRYPGVHLWMIWGEPTRRANFRPLVPVVHRRRTRPAWRRGPQLYARILDASYARLKRRSSRNLVVGGSSFTTGNVPPLDWIRLLRLPNGRRPRMDLYGHNPFTARRPDLRQRPLGHGWADFSDLDTLASALDANGFRGPRGGRMRLFLSELVLPTDHPNREFNFWLDRATQADWLAAALRITRRSRRIYSLGYLGLYDDPPLLTGNQVRRGLITWGGKRKPAYAAFKKG